ncbi:hypothetical protein AOLI_G00145370 [Acnodon oligacanthus]
MAYVNKVQRSDEDEQSEILGNDYEIFPKVWSVCLISCEESGCRSGFGSKRSCLSRSCCWKTGRSQCCLLGQEDTQPHEYKYEYESCAAAPTAWLGFSLLHPIDVPARAVWGGSSEELK